MAQCTPKSFDLTGKVALITGASYGIGMAIAKAMAANGATIVFNDIKQELVDKGIACLLYTSSTVGQNWRWRLKKTQLSKKLQKEICQLTTRYGRMNWA